MNRSVQTPATISWKAVWRFCVYPLCVISCVSLTACGSGSRTLNFEPPAAESWMTATEGIQGGDSFSPDYAGGLGAMSGKTEVLLPGTPNSYDLPKPITTLAMQGCSIKDRFDRSETLAYNFSDEQSRIAFDLNARGPSLSDPTRFEFRGFEMRFTYKMQKYKKPKERCLYPSPVQGLIGSIYNEFSLRQNDTIIQELRAKALDF